MGIVPESVLKSLQEEQFMLSNDANVRNVHHFSRRLQSVTTDFPDVKGGNGTPSSTSQTHAYLLLGAVLLTLIIFLIVFFKYRAFRLWSLVVLVVVLGFFAYRGHKEYVHGFFSTLNVVSKPLFEDAKIKMQEVVQKTTAVIKEMNITNSTNVLK